MASDEDMVKEILGIKPQDINTDPEIFLEDLVIKLAKRIYKLESRLGKAGL